MPRLNVVAPRARVYLALHPWVYWSAIACCAATVGGSLWSTHQGMVRQRAEWGESVDVWVAGQRADAGQPIVAQRATMPIAVIPDGAVTEDPGGRIAVHAVGQGELIVAADVSASGTAGLVGDGQVALTIAQLPLPPVAPGDRIIVYAVAERIADGTLVHVDRDLSAVTVAVPANQAPAVAEAITAGIALIALAGPAPQPP